MVTITEDILKEGMSKNGSWSAKQLRCLGVKTISHNKGWKKRLLGSKVEGKYVNMFLALKNTHLLKEPLLFG